MIIPVNQAQQVDKKMISYVYFPCVNFMISGIYQKGNNVINKCWS